MKLKKFRYYYWRAIVKLSRKLHFCFALHTSVGVKQINMNAVVNNGTISGELKDLNPQILHLGPDFLCDAYSLIEAPILQSPHYYLMKSLLDEKNVSQTEYFSRYVDGKLDWRIYAYPKCDEGRFRERFNKAVASIQSGDYPPVIVYKVRDRYYIYDGKHRAALCALKGTMVKCLITDSKIAYTNAYSYLFSMMRGKSEYSKHNTFKEGIEYGER